MADKLQMDDLQQKQSLPLEAKIRMTEQRIREWYHMKECPAFPQTHSS